MTTPALKFKITRAGLAAALNASNFGLIINFSHIAIGKGGNATVNGVGYTPTGDETALKQEMIRAPLGAGQKIADNQVMFAATVAGAATGWINEIGLFLSDGTLWAVWSEDPAVIQRNDPVTGAPIYGQPLGYKSAGVDYAFGALLVVNEFPLNILNLTLNGPPITLMFGDTQFATAQETQALVLNTKAVTPYGLGTVLSAVSLANLPAVATGVANALTTLHQTILGEMPILPGAIEPIEYDAQAHAFKARPATDELIGVGRVATATEATSGVTNPLSDFKKPWMMPEQVKALILALPRPTTPYGINWVSFARILGSAGLNLTEGNIISGTAISALPASVYGGVTLFDPSPSKWQGLWRVLTGGIWSDGSSINVAFIRVS